MMHAPRIRALETRHAEMETRIAHEGTRPRPDETALVKMKLEKLHLKDELERLRRAH
jgi:hypothetical protein